MDGKKISEAENLMSEANVEKYAKLYNLPRETVVKVLEAAPGIKLTLIGCGVQGEDFNLDAIFKAAGGKLSEDEDSTSQAIEGGVTQTRELSREEQAIKDRAAKRAFQEQANKKLHP